MFDFIYTSKRTMPLAEATASVERAAPYLTGFKKSKTCSSEYETLGFKGPLRPLRFPPGAELAGISEIQATLRMERSLASLQSLFKRVRPGLAVPCSLMVGTPIQTVTQSWGRGFVTGVSVGCEAIGGGSRLYFSTDTTQHDIGLLREFFTRLAGELSLPLQCIDHPSGFALSGRGGARVEMISTHPNGANPQAFRLGLPKLTWSQAPLFLWTVIQHFSKSQVALDWTLRPRPESNVSGGLKLLEAATRAKWPADSYEVSVEYRLRTMESLEALQKLLLGAKGQFRTFLADFSFGDREDGQVGIETTAKSHRLLLNMSSPVGAVPVLKAFGVKFEGDSEAMESPEAEAHLDSSVRNTSVAPSPQPVPPRKPGEFSFFASGESDLHFYTVPRLLTRDALFEIKRKLTKLPGEFLDFERAESCGFPSYWRGEGNLPVIRFNPEIRWRMCMVRLKCSTCGIPVSDFTRLFHDFATSFPEQQPGVPASGILLSTKGNSPIRLFMHVRRGKNYPSGSHCYFAHTKTDYEGPLKRAPKDYIQRVAASSPQSQQETFEWELTLESGGVDLDRSSDLGCRAYQWVQERSLPPGVFDVDFTSVIKGIKGFKFLEKLRRGESEIYAHLCGIKWSETSHATFAAGLLPKGNRLYLDIEHPDIKGAMKAISAALGLKFKRDRLD